MKKVFISSVMRDYDAQRQAVRTAIETLRQKPVMAEDFGAKPFSSQAACLDGVRQSDICIAVLGRRYGFVSSTGVSVCEEEFNEARQQGLPILVLVEKGDLEPRQKEFFDRIAKYEEGYFADFFSSAGELQTKTTKALYDYVGQPDVKTLTAGEAAAHLGKYLPRQSQQYGTNLVVLIFPARQGETYLSPVEMEKAERREALMKMALFGKSAVLRPTMGTTTVDGTEHFGLVQKSATQTVASIDFHANGTLLYDTHLGSDGGRDYSLSRQFIIDKGEVQGRLEAFVAFAASYYGSLDASAYMSSFYLAIVIRGVQQKKFGQLPKTVPSGMSIAMDSIPDPLMIPSQPYKVARADLNSPATLAHALTTLVERAFRSHGRLYSR